MGIAQDVAEGLSGVQAFVGSALGSGVISMLVTFPPECTVESCNTILGTSPMSQGEASFFSAGMAFVIGMAVSGLREWILSKAESGQQGGGGQGIRTP